MLKTFIATFFILLLLCSYANANAIVGFPLIVFTFPWIVYMLIPVICLEAYYFYRKLKEIKFKKCLRVMTICNLFTTLIGVPGAWLWLVGLNYLSADGKVVPIAHFLKKFIGVTLNAPWRVIYKSKAQGMEANEALMLIVPLFLVSWLIEAYICQIFLKKNYTRSAIFRVSFYANALSYIFLEISLLISLMTGLTAL